MEEFPDQHHGQPYTRLVSQMSHKIAFFFSYDRFFHAELQSFISSLTRRNLYKEMSDMGARLPQRQTFPCKCQHQAQATIQNNSMQPAKSAGKWCQEVLAELKNINAVIKGSISKSDTKSNLILDSIKIYFCPFPAKTMEKKLNQLKCQLKYSSFTSISYPL